MRYLLLLCLLSAGCSDKFPDRESYLKGCYDRQLEHNLIEDRKEGRSEYIFDYQKRYAKAICEIQYEAQHGAQK